MCKDAEQMKNYHRQYYEKHKGFTTQEILDNYAKVINIDNPVYLTTKGFNSYSKISSMATCKILKRKWMELLNDHDKLDTLFNYIVNEFETYYETTNDVNVQNFVRQHEYITQDVAMYFQYKKIKLATDFGSSRKYTKKFLIDNYNEIKRNLGFIPTRAEFEKNNRIDLKIYQNSFGCTSTSWENLLLELGENLEDIESLRSRNELIKRSNAKKGHIAKIEKYGIISEEDLKVEFKRIFDQTFEKFGTYPTRRLFNKISKFTDSAYRKRYKLRWSEIVKKYGYVNTNNNKSEKFVLESIKRILNSYYEEQKSWSWLIGSGGKKMFCDGYFPEYNLVVEFDGAQHRKPVSNMGGIKAFERRLINDELKNSLLKENNINLLRIDSRTNWHDEKYLSSLLEKYVSSDLSVSI